MSSTWLHNNVVYALFFVLLALLLCFPIQANDLFFYLSLGRIFFQEASIPNLDPFLYTFKNWSIYHEWLAAVAFYFSYVIAGYVGVTLLKTGLWLVAFAVLVKAAKQWRTPDFVTLVFLCLAVIACTQRFTERGSLFSDLFLLTLTVRFLHPEPLSRAWLWRAPILFMAWVNLHAGFVIGITFFTAYVLLLWKSAPRWLWLSLGLSYAALLVNPDFYHGAIYPLQTAFKEEWALYRQMNPEWMAPFKAPYVHSWQVWCLGALMVLSTLSLIWLQFKRRWQFNRQTIFASFALLIFIYLAVDAVRFISTSSLSLSAIALFALGGMSNHWKSAVRFGFTGLFAFLIVWVVLRGYGPGLSMVPRHVGFGLDEKMYPVAATEFIQKQNLQGRFFNEYSWGAYMIWILNRRDFLFVHSHVDDPRIMANAYMGMNADPKYFQETVQNLGIQYFILSKFNLAGDPPPGILTSLKPWRLIYQDDTSAIWQRPVQSP